MDPSILSRDALRNVLGAGAYRIVEAPHPDEALRLLETEGVDIVVIDFRAPENGGPQLCRSIKTNPQTRLLPVLIVSEAEAEIEAIDSGADEVLIHPLRPAVVRARIRLLLRHKAVIDSLEDTESILFALAQAIEHRDKSARRHCERLAAIGVALGIEMGLPRSDLRALHCGGYLHDIGKISVPDAILFKPGPLTAEEWTVMRGHTVKGEEICRGFRTLAPVIPIIRSHHERWDGSGYPDGLAGEQIPLAARILQVADVYDALISVRPYKPALSPAQALETLERETAMGWRDPGIAALFRSVWQRSQRESLENMRDALAG